VAPLIALVAFLAVYNNATNLLRLPDTWYIPGNLAVAGLLLAFARWRGLSWRALGLAGETAAAGLRLGALVTLAVAAGLALALAVPALEPLLLDQRIAGLTLAGLAWQTLVRIPLGTVVLEEVAFRGVLLAAWERQAGLTAAVIGSSVVFGLWHIGPTIVALRINALPLDGRGWLAVAGAVVATAVAGVLFCLLRWRSGSLLAPMMAHVATNSLGTLAAFVAQRP
jgi:uncharacterized protein